MKKLILFIVYGFTVFTMLFPFFLFIPVSFMVGVNVLGIFPFLIIKYKKSKFKEMEFLDFLLLLYPIVSVLYLTLFFSASFFELYVFLEPAIGFIGEPIKDCMRHLIGNS